MALRFQVPQFVDIEDKVIGPLTIKQFLIYIGAVLLLTPVYLLSDLSLFVTVALPVMGIAALFAHFRLHGKSLFSVLGAALGFFLSGSLWLWSRGGDDALIEITGPEFEGISRQDRTVVQQLKTLAARSQELETAGKVTEEDLADPLTETEAVAPPAPEHKSAKNGTLSPDDNG